MKILLILSLIANVILGVLYFQEKSQPPIERIIMEEKPAKIIREEVLVPVESTAKKPKSKKSSHDELPLLNPDGEVMAQDYEEAVEHIETAKEEYLMNKLGIPEETIKKEGQLRAEFFNKTNKYYGKSPLGEVSIADRRKILDLEEELQRKIEALYGKENWQKFQNYQKKYNERVIKRVKEENAPAILMGP